MAGQAGIGRQDFMKRLGPNIAAMVLVAGIGGGAVLSVFRFSHQAVRPASPPPFHGPSARETRVTAARDERGASPSVEGDPARPGDLAGAARAFEGWVTEYLSEPQPEVRATMIAAGIAAAEQRRRALYEWIARDPEAALRAAVPWGVRKGLPPEVERWLERRVSGKGDYLVVAALPDLSGESSAAGFAPIRRRAVIEGQAFEAHVYGRLSERGTQSDVPLHGIVVGDRMAVLDSPLRLLDPGEPIPPGRRVDEICPVSGRPAGPRDLLPGQVPTVADLGDRAVHLCSPDHAGALAAAQGDGPVAAAGSDGGVAEPVDAPDAAIGKRRLLYIRVRFADQAASFEPQGESGVLATVAEADAFLRENSSGRFTIEATVTPVYTLPRPASWYAENDTTGYARNVFDAAVAVAAQPAAFPGNAGLPPFSRLDYDSEVVRYTGGPGAFTGQAYISRRGIWMKTDAGGVLAHEICHNLGLWHANAWRPDDPGAPVASGRNDEYGDVFDTMGRNAGGHWHLNAHAKSRLGWLSEGSVASVDGVGGTFLIHAHDLPEGWSPGAPVALRIPRDQDRAIWVEVRRHPAWAANRWVMNGLGLRWDPWLLSNGGTQLLDATPFSPEGFTDSALIEGRTYSDAAAGVFITVASAGADPTGPVEVDVRLGSSPGNRPPFVMLSASSSRVEPGEAVVLSAVAGDEDGDALVYGWDFGDGSVVPSEPIVTHTWSGPGHRAVRVVVSDRKGGVASGSVLVRVGEPAGFVLRGRVVDVDGAAVAGVRIHNSLPLTHPGLRQAWTDSDGSFMLVGVPAGEWAVRGEKAGWLAASAGFQNPVPVAGDLEGVDFVACAVGHRVSGVVRAADGTPVGGVLVSDGIRTEPTDTAGAFVLHGLATGRHVISVVSGDRVFQATMVEVAGADVSNVRLQERTFAVSGWIEGVDPSVTTTVTDGIRSTTSFAQMTSEGTRSGFGLTGIPAGTAHLVAMVGGMVLTPSNFTNPIRIRDDRANLVFRADESPGQPVSGRVVAAGTGVPEITVTIDGQATKTDGAGRFMFPRVRAGTHTVRVEGSGWQMSPVNLPTTVADRPVEGVDFEARPENTAPFFVRAASISGGVGRRFAAVSAEADDDGDGACLRYVWSSVGATPAPVLFTVNDANAAREAVALFSAAGSYRLRVTATDRHGASASSEVVVDVPALASGMRIVAPNHPLWVGGTGQFIALCTDQFGAPMAPAPRVGWKVSGGGTIDTAGLFTGLHAGREWVVAAALPGLEATCVFSVGYPPGPGWGAALEIWSGIAGTRVEHLTSAPAFPARPNHVTVLRELLETPGGLEHNYGQRVRAYFVPPVTGNHVFRISSDNASELWLSPGCDPSERVLAASVATRTGRRSWDELPSQRSAPVYLVEGRPVYLEVLHKENSQDDHLAVAVELPGGVWESPIPAHRLLPWGEAAYDPPRIDAAASAQPQSVGAEMSTVVSVGASSDGGAAMLTYHWEVAGHPPGPVAFLPNGTGEARTAVARFARAGSYRLRVVVADLAGQTAESTVEVEVRETLTSWRRRFFTSAELDNLHLEGTRWGPNADPDSDGVANLLEYAFGLDPLVPSVAGLPSAHLVTVDGEEYLAVTFRRNPLASDLVYTPQSSSDLLAWEDGLVFHRGPVEDAVTYRDRQAARAFDTRFVRVKVTGP